MILVVDLEATCSDDGSIGREAMEIIEVGACWATREGLVLEQFQSFVRPSTNPLLTSFCKSLTRIGQSDVDAATDWREVAPALGAFAARHWSAAECWGSWGNYDARQIEHDSAQHRVANPLAGLTHQNLKAGFAKRRKIKQVGMATALRISGLELEGEHHRALADAMNIARLLPWSLS
jgi:inhibitor of KinA sporulation pathway (predicted exonuclease)